jgi:hypothetical protein
MTKKKQKNPHTNNKKQEEISQGLEHPERYFFFWKKESPFSQWHDSPYECNGYTYTCAEQGMMHCKALLFGDEHIARAILQETTDPQKLKPSVVKYKTFLQISGMIIGSRLSKNKMLPSSRKIRRSGKHSCAQVTACWWKPLLRPYLGHWSRRRTSRQDCRV